MAKKDKKRLGEFFCIINWEEEIDKRIWRRKNKRVIVENLKWIKGHFHQIGVKLNMFLVCN
jgi:hypothetical protein